MIIVYIALAFVVGAFIAIIALFIIFKVSNFRLRKNLKEGDHGHFYPDGDVRHFGVVKKIYKNGNMSVYSCDNGLTYRLKDKKQFTI